MSDTQLTGGATKVWVLDGATTAEINNAQAAFDAMSTDIDDLLSARTNLWFRSAAAVASAANYAGAWGWSPKGRTSQVNRERSPVEQRYIILHELGGHHSDRDKLNAAKRTALQAIMTPAGTGWNAGKYIDEPNECYADTFPRAYAPATITKANGKLVLAGYYGKQVHSASLASYRSITAGAGGPATTALAAASSIGATNIRYTSITGSLVVDDWIRIDTDTDIEVVQITAVGTSGSGGTGISLADALTIAHANGTAVAETTATPPPGDNVIVHTVTRNTNNGNSQTDSFTIAAGTTGKTKMRYSDGTAWGPYSDEAAVSLGAAAVGVTQPTVTPGTQTPDFGASLSGYGIYGYLLSVYQVLPGGNVLAFRDGPTFGSFGTRVSVHCDTQLQWDQPYTWSILLTGTPVSTPIDTWAALPWTPFTPTLDTGPLITYGGNPVDLTHKIDTLTPTFRLTPNAGGNIDQARLRIWNFDGTTLLHDSGLIGPFTAAAYRDIAVPANKLAWGLNIQVDGAVRADGETALGNYNAQKFNAHVNAQPGAPSPVTVRSDTAQIVRRADGVWVTSTATPILVLPYRDVDRDLGYTDDPNRREIELRDLADAHVGASPYVITTGITDEWTVPASLLDADTTLKARADYDDSADVRSAFSQYVNLRYSEAPTLSAVTPATGAVVTDPTQTFAWTYDSDADKLQASYHLLLSVGGDQTYDSGVVPSAEHTLTVPVGALASGQTGDFQLYVYDTDGLYALASGTFTTAFAAPDAITGLTLTPDIASDSIIVGWSATADAAFYAYNVYARSEGGQFRRIEILDPNVTALALYAAAHNIETTVRVTQTNGLLESEPAEASATLGGAEGTDDFIYGDSLTRPDAFVLLPRSQTVAPGSTRHGAGDTQTDLEVFTPPGRGEKVILDWGTTGYEATLSLFTQDRELLLMLRRWKEQGTVSIYKTSYGAVRYVRLTSTPDTDQPAGWIDSAVSYIEVLPSAVDW